MGVTTVQQRGDGEAQRAFMKTLLRDVRALEQMLSNGMIESGIRRIGAEQELFIVDRSWRPAPLNDAILNDLNDEECTTELAKFNMEFNLPPLVFGGDCLSKLEHLIDSKLVHVRNAARKNDAEVVLCGILPSLLKSDLEMSNLSDRPRYRVLNDALTNLRGGPYKLSIEGIDELNVEHDNVMLESCNTSFQVHFQVGPDEFARAYNTAQAVTAPVLAAASNSPLLFGKRLWRETRIALFQQSIDTRQTQKNMREFIRRVSFGTHWVRHSVLEIFQEDIARFKALFNMEPVEDPIELIAAGHAPRLVALCLHNGTVYRWNRACYGVGGGKPHLRIENRVIPAGPTPRDEIANAAFWFGLMSGVSQKYGDISTVMEFDDAAANFNATARLGLEAQLTWPGHGHRPARELLLEYFIPLAREGLRHSGIDEGDIATYLDTIQARVDANQTGAQWTMRTLASMKDIPSRMEQLTSLTAAMVEHQRKGDPVHTWPTSMPEGRQFSRENFTYVGQYMTTDLFTVHENDVVDLVANLMDWKHVRHVPVEDDDHHLVGLVSHRSLLRFMGQGGPEETTQPVPVSAIMHREPTTVSPQTSTLDAIRIMQENKVGCLPVTQDGTPNGRLIGLVTEHDLIMIAAPLLERFLRE